MNIFASINHISEPNHSTYVNKIGTVAGWGARAEQGSSSCILRHVDMPIISNIDCFENSHYKNLSNFLVTEYMMCAGYPKGGYDSCQVSFLLTHFLNFIYSIENLILSGRFWWSTDSQTARQTT